VATEVAGSYGVEVMKKFAAGLLSLGCSFVVFGTANAADLGKFTRPSTGATVDFYDCGGNLCGKIVAVTNPKEKSLVGKLIVDGAKPSGDGAWKGSLLDAASGKTYKGTITLVGDGLKLEGCVMRILCSGEVWKPQK
jgi:uncharacterized protein (DUF2147 family)